MKLLHLDSSILGGNSVSRMLSAAAVARLRDVGPDLDVTYRDLAAEPIPHLSGQFIAASRGAPADEKIRNEIELSRFVLEEFMKADIVVIGVAFYNLTIPSQLKAWIDRILIPGQTFRYGPDGRPVGLAGRKRVVLAIARGGFFGAGAPNAAFEHAESYLRAALAFIGISDPETVTADGLAAGPEQRASAIASAKQRIAALPA